MSFFCPICKQKHAGWPALQFAFPEEYLKLSDQEKELRCFVIPDGFKIEQKDHTHYYTLITWPQKVINSNYVWHFKLWVMVDNINMVEQLRSRQIDSCAATLQSNLPWYRDFFLGFPIQLRYDFAEKMIRIDKIVHQNSTIYNDYTLGLPYDVAKGWSENIVESGNWACPD